MRLHADSVRKKFALRTVPNKAVTNQTRCRAVCANIERVSWLTKRTWSVH
jgi:hypothetical protein